MRGCSYLYSVIGLSMCVIYWVKSLVKQLFLSSCPLLILEKIGQILCFLKTGVVLFYLKKRTTPTCFGDEIYSPSPVSLGDNDAM